MGSNRGLRGAESAPRQGELPLGRGDNTKRALDAIDGLKEGLEELRQSVIAAFVVPEPPAPPPVRLAVPSVPSKSLVERSGRMTAEGKRRGARTLRKMSIYLTPERAQALEDRAYDTRRTMSDIIEEALDRMGVAR